MLDENKLVVIPSGKLALSKTKSLIAMTNRMLQKTQTKELATSSRDLVLNENVWIDKRKSLMWQVDVSFETYNWNDSFEYIKNLNAQKYGGFDDWRLPTIDELKSLLTSKIINFQRLHNSFANKPNISSTGYAYYIKKQLIESIANSKTKGLYWSDTLLNEGSHKAWSIGFEDGSIVAYSRKKRMHIRSVRGTK